MTVNKPRAVPIMDIIDVADTVVESEVVLLVVVSGSTP